MVLQISRNKTLDMQHIYLVSERKQLQIPVIYFLYLMFSDIGITIFSKLLQECVLFTTGR